jgi:WD40 repeat protein
MPPPPILRHKAEGGEARAILRGHRGPITCVDGMPHGRRVLSGSTDMTIRLWDWWVRVVVVAVLL